MAIVRDFQFVIDLSPERSRECTSEGQKAVYNFEDGSPILFIQIEMFNILVSGKRLRHRELRNKVNIIKEFDTGDLVVVIKLVKSSRKYGIAQKLAFKTKLPYRVLEKATPRS